MKDSRVSLTAAQNALTQAQDDLRLASVKYKLGTMSRLSVCASTSIARVVWAEKSWSMMKSSRPSSRYLRA